MTHHRPVPRTLTEWAIWLWAFGGVVALLIQAVLRIAPRSAVVFDGERTAVQLGIAAVWVGFMLYSEAWRGFHKNFSPRVVARASALLADRRPWLVVLAPAMAMGLIHATPRRLLVSRLLVAGIVALVLSVRYLSDPWRGIVDLGVALGLAVGVLSMIWHAAGALWGTTEGVDPELPAPIAASGTA